MAKNPVGQGCENCRYGRNIGKYSKDNEYLVGWCQRYPPDVDGIFPNTGVGEWYGEWAPENPETIDEGCAIMARLVLLGDLTAARALADKLRE